MNLNLEDYKQLREQLTTELKQHTIGSLIARVGIEECDAQIKLLEKSKKKQ